MSDTTETVRTADLDAAADGFAALMEEHHRLRESNTDLLEALEGCDRAFAGWQVGVPPGRPEDILALIVKVRSAMKKARGE